MPREGRFFREADAPKRGRGRGRGHGRGRGKQSGSPDSPLERLYRQQCNTLPPDKVEGDTTARLVVFVHWPKTAGTLMRRAFGCAGWQSALSAKPHEPRGRAVDQMERAYCRHPADLTRVAAMQLRHHARVGSTPHIFLENHCDPSVDVPLAISDVLTSLGLLSRVTFQSVAILRHPVHTVESIYAQFDGEIEQIDHRWRGRLPKPLFFRAAAEYLLFTWLQLGVETDGTHCELDSRRLERRRRVQRQAIRRTLRQRHALAVAHRFPDLRRRATRRRSRPSSVTQRVRSVDLLHTRPCEPLVAAGLGRLRRLSHVFLLEDARTLREIRRLSTLDPTRAVPHQLVQPRARLMHAEQRPSTRAQKIEGGGCAVATNLEHTCSLELYTQVATTIGARSNFTLG